MALLKGEIRARCSIKATGPVTAGGENALCDFSSGYRGARGQGARAAHLPLYLDGCLGNEPGLSGFPARLAGPGLVEQSAYAEFAAGAAASSTVAARTQQPGAAGAALSRSLRG